MDGQGMKNSEMEVSEDSGDLDGPDTSSFTAFLISLLSSSDSGSYPVEDLNDYHAEIGDAASASEIREKSEVYFPEASNHWAKPYAQTKLSGFRQSSEPKTTEVNKSKPVEHEMKPVKVSQEICFTV